MVDEARRSTDIWVGKLSAFFDWFDNRDIDKHLMVWATFAVTCYLMYWVTEYVWAHSDKSGLDVGAVVAALLLPWTPVQAKVIDWYFKVRANGK